MKGSLIIVSFFILGTLCGFYHLIPYDFTDSKLSYYALCGLMFCVGISIGNDPNFHEPKNLFRLYGSGSRIRLLFPFEYIHHRI
mgnify:CR=1 FL=1